ncbi:pilus retraction protein PilT [Desulfonatronum thiosulfatophilum]|uniref:Pilus retraction protein PilT n=1 Tax=Desulfonatronum thiosulfatophilum TaxID=617002 RepID=A0A1G6CN96_9BACT|nr:PilT/PilU family type 4a pilus ATPase [Desulfonatronum thiosulfatophilum]SDB34347.1 pilus retraction protein PilT [Desulfonatronum thiosulfatophilum]
MKRFNNLVDASVEKGFSDIHITGGHPVVYRSHGQIIFDKKVVFSHEDVDRLVREILTEQQLEMLKRKWSVDFALSASRVRLRINIFKTTRGLSLAIRLLPGVIPSVENLNLHPTLKDICRVRAGLALICGTTGSGKSTTIAALVNEINQNRNEHIVTLEDPIEYRFTSSKSFIEQRELGTHIPSFEQGLIDVLREDPDVIVIGELREPETIRLALNAAESGHLVIATLHATNVEDAVYRICNSFPLDVQEFVRFQLSSAMVCMVIQQLVYLEQTRFRVPVLSILRSTQAVKGLIRDNRMTQLENTMHMSRKEGMFTHRQYMEYLEGLTTFVPPSRIFMPSAETVPDIIYEPPLFRETVAPQPAASEPGESRSAHRSRQTTVADLAAEAEQYEDRYEEHYFGKSYKISGEEDLLEVVNDISETK